MCVLGVEGSEEKCAPPQDNFWNSPNEDLTAPQPPMATESDHVHGIHSSANPLRISFKLTILTGLCLYSAECSVACS